MLHPLHLEVGRLSQSLTLQPVPSRTNLFMLKRTLLLLTALVSLTIASFAYPLTYTKHDPHSFHGGECYGLILRAIRGAEPQVDDNGVVGITVQDADTNNAYGYKPTIWHDSITGCDISDGGESGFDFTVTKGGKVVLTAHWAQHGHTSTFTLKPLVKLPIE